MYYLEKNLIIDQHEEIITSFGSSGLQQNFPVQQLRRVSRNIVSRYNNQKERFIM